jgi:NADH-quinone oxidoreductase subunit N
VSLLQLVDHLLRDTLDTSLAAFRPELAICATIVLILLVRLVWPRWKGSSYRVMLAGTAAAFFLAAPWHYLSDGAAARPEAIFTGMLVFDGFAVYMRALILGFVLLVVILTRIAGTVGPGETTEFYVLVLGATLGMCLMVSADHMLVVFLGIEMASVPSYALAGFLKGRRQSSEAALKYAVFGAATAGVMLYGISLLCGVFGSPHLPTMAAELAAMIQRNQLGPELSMVLALGSLMVAVGLAFKLSAVPFHQWAPDVFEGAAAEVAAFLSVASKAAALALLVRLAIGFSYVEPQSSTTLEPVRHNLAGLIALLAAVTCTFGNLAAYGQTNIKRLLAYSTIAHAGYMMMAVAAAVTLVGADVGGARGALAAVAFYLGVYLFMNLGVFAGVAFLRGVLGSEEIADYAGLVRRSPGLAVCLAVLLFSLIGLPPLAGFAAKFTVFAALFNAGLLGLLVIGAANTVLSLFYYLRVVKVMLLEPEKPDRSPARIALLSPPGLFCLAMTAPVLVLGVWWNGLLGWAEAAAASLLL